MLFFKRILAYVVINTVVILLTFETKRKACTYVDVER